MTMFPSWILLLILPISVSACSLECAQDAPCVTGSTSFTDHHLNDGTVHSFHEETSRNNEYCSCPHGWTGLLCDVKFEGCDGSHKCYHGGRCIPGLKDSFGNEQLYCSCEGAIDDDGNQYVGKFCEHSATKGKTCDHSDDSFCLHGGTCNSQFPSEGEPCNCPVGYEGPHCEYATGSTPSCDMDCRNGGQCILGSKENLNDSERYQFWDHKGFKHMYCSCPDGFDGPYCEIKKDSCGQNHCFHGGRCIERSVDGEVLHHCDCTEANKLGDTSYAGRFCQYEATSYCTKSSGLQGHLFCVNNGTCKSDPYDGCSCQKGFTGFSCEYVTSAHVIGGPDDGPPDDEDDDDDYARQFGGDIDDGKTVVDIAEGETPCTLACDNGGTCRNGLKDLGQLEDLQSSSFANRDQGLQHCICPKGFAGTSCEIKVETCSSGHHMCFHGGKCVQFSNKEECDCVGEFSGHHCEHASTEICTEGERSPGAPLSFCVNGADCVRKVTASEGHAGCICKEGWTGRHCELREGFDYDDDDDDTQSFLAPGKNQDKDGRDPLLVAVLVLSVTAILAVVAFAMNQRRRRKQREDKALSSSMRWNSDYSDKPEQQVNIAPRRRSTLTEECADAEDVYMASVASPNRDPMATHLAPTIEVPEAKPEAQFEDGDTPKIYIGPPRDEDGHELHSINII